MLVKSGIKQVTATETPADLGLLAAHGQTLATLGTAALEHQPTILCAHANRKRVRARGDACSADMRTPLAIMILCSKRTANVSEPVQSVSIHSG